MTKERIHYGRKKRRMDWKSGLITCGIIYIIARMPSNTGLMVLATTLLAGVIFGTLLITKLYPESISSIRR